MAQRKRESTDESPARERTASSSAPRLHPETRHGVLIVTLFALTALTFLSLLGFAGAFGGGVKEALVILMGWGRWIVPLLLAAIGLYLARPDRQPVKATQVVGAVALLLAAAAILNVSGQSIDDGIGGGVIGYLLWSPLFALMGTIAAVVVCLAVLLIGILLVFNTSLMALLRRGQVSGQKVGRLVDQAKDAIREAADSEDEDDETTSSEPAFARRSVADGTTEAGESDSGEPTPRKPRRPRRQGLSFPLDLLDQNGTKPTSANIDINKEKIQKTLENFGIPVEMDEVHVGPTVTQFTLKPAEGVKLSQITTLANDLALALAAHPIRIEAPIPGKSLVGIEVPNQKVGLVNLRDVLASDNFGKHKSALAFSLGRDVAGEPLVADLDPMPHLLIAGATGSGKSVMINALIVSMLAKNAPEDLKFIMVDPKRVELTVYNNVPHLLTPVITDTTKTINALRWVVNEMDRRYQVLSNAGKRNIAAYHADVSDDMPYLVLVIDELADLMTVAANEVEGAIVRLAQMARAVGIHLVLATQRPSVDVITGLIKANITARIAFTVASLTDSRTILDHSGAEKLLGRGDMLFLNAELSKPRRIQGAFVSDAEIERVTTYLKEQGNPEYVNEVVEKPAPSLAGGFDDMEDDELIPQAKDVIMQAGKASASLLQRRLRVGYARAARLLDLLEEQGFIGPGEGAKPREILVAQAPTEPLSLDSAPEDEDTEPSDEDEAARSV